MRRLSVLNVTQAHSQPPLERIESVDCFTIEARLTRRTPHRLTVRGLCLASVAVCLFAFSALPAAAYNEQLTDKYQRILIREICRQSDWLACYKIPPATCKDVFSADVERCVRTLVREPKVSVKEPAEVEALAGRIAHCVQGSFIERYKDSKLANEECKDIS